MLSLYSDQIGYINNKKGVCSSTVNDTTIMYSLGTEETSSGKRLFIQTSSGNNSGKLSLTNKILPKLPYRIITNDPTYMLNKQPIICSDYTFINFYNPGITATTNSVTYPYEFLSGSTRFIELNVSRNMIGSFTSWSKYQSYNNYDMRVHTSYYKVHDVQASIIVENNSTIDNLILTVVSRIEVFYSYSYQNKFKSKKEIYSVPVTVMLKIDRSNITDQTVIEKLPYSWNYPIPSDWLSYTPNISIGKINNLATSFTSNMWNYNLIPGVEINNTYFKPVSYGCLCDSCRTGTNTISTISSIGNFLIYKNEYNQVHTISNVTLTTAGYNNYNYTNTFNTTKSISSKVAIENFSSYYITNILCYEFNKKENILTFFNTQCNLVSSRTIGPLLIDSDIEVNNNQLYIYLRNSTNNYIYRFPTINDAFFSFFNHYKYFNSGSIEVIFNVLNMTNIHNESIAFKEPTYSTQKLIDKNENDIFFNVDLITQDKSFIDNFNLTYNDEFNYLRKLTINIIMLDKINQISTTNTTNIINNRKFFKV